MPDHANRLLTASLAGSVREPLLFDWRGQLACADAIIARVGAPVRNMSSSHRPSQPSDLKHLREAIAKLLAELQETYLTALGDYQLRNDPKRPERKLRKKDIVLIDATESGGFDYSEFDCEPDQSWEQFYDEVYARPRGAPGHSRLGGPPIKPLYPVFDQVRRWWRSQGLGAFSLIFNIEARNGYDEACFNAPLRFLLSVIQSLDPAYTIENLRSVCEKRRKDLKVRKAK